MTQPLEDEGAHLKALAETYRRRLQLLAEQIAKFGLYVPPHIALDQEQTERELATLERQLRRLRPSVSDEQEPYKGLHTFQEEDSELFFGREALIAELVAKVERSSFLAVMGPSGSGKSSVVRAGLIPQLKDGALPGSARWRYVTMKPGVAPIDSLAVALAKLQGRDLGTAMTLSRQLAENDRALLLCAAMLLDDRGDGRLVIVVDQFEELWSLAPTDPVQRAAFVETQQRPFVHRILDASTSLPPGVPAPVLTIITMRADFLYRAAEHQELAALISDHLHIVSPMSADDLRWAIAGPARLAQCDFEPGLVQELVREVSDQPGALPLLQYTLLEMWKQRVSDNTLTWDSFNSLGRVAGALASRADVIVKERYPNSEQQEKLRWTLLRLVQPGEGAADTRRRVLLDDLTSASQSISDIQILLKPLVDARLLTSGYDEASGAETIELAHEAIIHAWPTFSQWINEARADLRLQLQIEAAAKEWLASGNNIDFLWSGLRLANALAWLRRSSPLLNARDQAFIDASQAQEEQRKREAEQARQREVRRLRTFLAVGAILLVSIAGLALVTLRSLRASQAQTRVARAEALAAQSRLLNTETPQVSTLLALEAIRVTRTVDGTHLPAAEQALFDSLSRIGGQSLSGHTAGVWLALFSPDGKRLITGGEDHTVRLWGLATSPMTSTALYGHTGAVRWGVWSPDGRYVVTSGIDSRTLVWDTTRTPITSTPLPEHEGSMHAAVFSLDGRYLATGSSDAKVRLYDMTRSALPSLIRIFSGHTSYVRVVAFSRDGRYLLTGSGDQTARLWDLEAKDLGAAKTVLEGHQGAVQMVAFSSDEERVIIVTDYVAQIWNIKSPHAPAVMKLLRGHTDQILATAVSRDGRWLVTAGKDHTAILWDLTATDPAANPRVLRAHESFVEAVAISSDGTRLVSGSDDRTARLWDLTDADPATTSQVLHAHDNSVLAVAFSPDNTRLVTGGYDGTVRLWQLTSEHYVAEPVGSLHHASSVQTVAFRPGNDAQLAVGGADGVVQLWDFTNDSFSDTVIGKQDSSIRAIGFSSDGKYLITGDQDSTVRRWDLTAGHQQTSSMTLHGSTGAIGTVAISHDGTRLAAGGSDGSVRIWTIASNPSLNPTVLHGHTGAVTALAFDADGKRLASGDEHAAVTIWDLTAGNTNFNVLPGHTADVVALAFSPDGKRLASGSYDNTVRVWRVNGTQFDPNPIILRGHLRPVVALAFSSDGRRLASGSWDDTARLWDLTAENPDSSQIILHSHKQDVHSVAFSPDGTILAIGSADQTVHLWRLDLDQVIDLACQVVGRNLTVDEWERFFSPQPYRKTCTQLLEHPSATSYKGVSDVSRDRV